MTVIKITCLVVNYLGNWEISTDTKWCIMYMLKENLFRFYTRVFHIIYLDDGLGQSRKSYLKSDVGSMSLELRSAVCVFKQTHLI